MCDVNLPMNVPKTDCNHRCRRYNERMLHSNDWIDHPQLLPLRFENFFSFVSSLIRSFSFNCERMHYERAKTTPEVTFESQVKKMEQPISWDYENPWYNNNKNQCFACAPSHSFFVVVVVVRTMHEYFSVLLTISDLLRQMTCSISL